MDWNAVTKTRTRQSKQAIGYPTATGGADHTHQSGLEYGHHVYPTAERLCLFGRRPGLVQSLRVVLGGVHYYGCALLSRRPGAGVVEGAT